MTEFPNPSSPRRPVRAARRRFTIILIILTLFLFSIWISSAFKGLGLFYTTGKSMFFVAWADGLIGGGFGEEMGAKSGLRVEMQDAREWHWWFFAKLESTRGTLAVPLWLLALCPAGVLAWQWVAAIRSHSRPGVE